MSGVVFVLGSSAHALTLGASATGGVQVGVGSAMQATGSMQMEASSSGSSSDGLMNVDVGASLESQAQAVSNDTSSENAVVQLQGNTIGMIETQADLDAYNTLVVRSRPVVTGINVDSNNNVTIHYSQPAKLFGIFPATLSGQVDVDANGNTTIHLPWWGMFYSKNTANVQASVAAAVMNVQASGGTSLQTSARVIGAATEALQAQANVSASANVNAQSQ